MPLSAGDKLGPYEILSPIGAGGMGEVWKARDTRLDRTVAIKTSKVEFNERFEREARAVAALNHPHICQLYDVGPNYLVMEFVDGKALKGPLPLEQALAIAIQLADALDAAHKKGITHRDLKPANALLTKSGVKVLDFGLAKIDQRKTMAAKDATLTQAVTQQGAIVGTLQYMAPEQLQGKENVDSRADIFSFGCVVYEMLTGKRAFDGSNAASVIAAILERPAPSVTEVAPAALDRVLKKCLAKDPEERWQTARDLKDELVWIAAGGTESPGRAKAYPAGWIVAAVLLVAAVAAFAGWMLKPALVRPVSRTVIALGPEEHLANLNSPAIAISSDGANVVYVASRPGAPDRLFLRSLDALNANPIPGTEGAASPFFSPDGQWIVFFAGGKLKKIAVAGGAGVTLSDAAPTPTDGGAWGPNNTILVQSATGAFLQVPASGGSPRRLTTSAKHGVWRWPEVTPGGGAVLFAGAGRNIAFASISSIAAAALDGSGAEKDLLAGGSAPRLAATGDLIYVQNGTLMAVPFNSRSLKLEGSPAPVLEGVRESMLGAAQYSLSASGTLVYVPGGLQSNSSRLIWVDRAGKEQPIAAPTRDFSSPRLSPDGRRIGVTIAGTETQVWLYDLARDTLARATFGGTLNANPIWSPDGKRLAFQSNRAGPTNLFSQPAYSSEAPERLTTTSRFTNAASSWSPDGQTIAYVEASLDTGLDIWTLGLADRKTRPFLQTQYSETAPRFSPDGHWLAYASDESGRWEVYVQAYPGPGGKSQISTDGGTEPAWNPAGRELFYRSGNRMMAVQVMLQPAFSAGRPAVLFEGPWLLGEALSNFDVSPDGRRFLMLKDADRDQDARQIVVIQNWFEELKRRMAGGKK